MMQRSGNRGGRVVGALGMAALMLLLFPAACSKKETRVTTSQAKTCVPFQDPFPGKPYCRIDLSYPISSVYKPHIYIYKQDRRMQVVQDNTLIRDYSIALGPSPFGDKLLQGDGRTPEGEFFICVKNPQSKFYKSLGLNYPAPRHADQALACGKISPDEYRGILEANLTRRLPPANTCLGGAIFIHGGGAYQDWTQGCIATSNTSMDELFEMIPEGTPVHVLP